MKNILEKITILCGVVLYFLPKYIAPVCGPMPNGKHMACFYSAHLLSKISIIIVVVTIVMLFTSKYNFGKIFGIIGSLINIIVAAGIYLVPNGIIKMQNEVGKYYGLCRGENHPCHHTFHMATVIGIIIIILMLFNLVYIFLKKER